MKTKSRILLLLIVFSMLSTTVFATTIKRTRIIDTNCILDCYTCEKPDDPFPSIPDHICSNRTEYYLEDGRTITIYEKDYMNGHLTGYISGGYYIEEF